MVLPVADLALHLVFGECRHAAETGHVVFGTLHTNSAQGTINRIIDVFPTDQQAQVRTLLSESMRGIVAQQLLKKKSGKSRVAVNEILVGSGAVSNTRWPSAASWRRSTGTPPSRPSGRALAHRAVGAQH